MHLLGHHGGGLVDGGHALGLGGGGEGSRGGGRHIVDGVGHHGAGGVVVGTSGGRSHGVGGGSHGVGGDPVAGGGGHPGDGVSQLGPGTGAGQDEGECDLGVVGVRFFANFDFQFSGHCAGSNPVVSFTKGFTYKRPHADGDLPLSC